jgi:hypothetical protein
VDIQNKHDADACLSTRPPPSCFLVVAMVTHDTNMDLASRTGHTALELAKTEEINERIANHVNTSFVLKCADVDAA